MEEFAPLLLILFFWLVIGLPISMAKKNVNQKQAAQRTAAQQAPAETKAPAAPRPSTPERLTTLTPGLSVPDHDDSVFTGSLGPVHTEGYDPCHDEQLSGLEPVCLPGREEPSVREVSGLPLGWTANDVVKGIVMSEILNRKH